MKLSAPLACLTFCAAAPLAFAAATATVTITGGPSAGKHTTSSDFEGACSNGATGRNSFGTQISNPKDKDPKKLNSVQVDVPDKSKPTQFLVHVGFGPLIGRKENYVIDTLKKAGNGSIAIAESGSTAQVKFSGTTKEGVKLEGTIDCKGVLKIGG